MSAQESPQSATALRQTPVWVLMAALPSACVAFQLNASMLAPLLVTLERELSATAAEIGLTQTAFFTTAALFSLFLPRLGDKIGRRKVLVAMLALTAVGTTISALAPNVAILFLGRLLAGVSGPVIVMCIIILRSQITEPRTFGTLMGVISAVAGGVAGLDTLAGGYIAQESGGPAVFWTMTVVGVIAAALVRIFVPETHSGDTARMDWWGALALVVSVGCLLTAFNLAQDLASVNWVIVASLAVVSVLAFIGFYRIEASSAAPLVEIQHLRHRSTWALVATTSLTLTGIFAVMNGLIPALAQDPDIGAGLTAGTVSWWTLTPYALVGFILGPFAGRLAATFGYRTVLRVGLVVVVVVHVLGAIFLVGNPFFLLAFSLAVGIGYCGAANIMLSGPGVVLSPKTNPRFLPGLNAGGFNIGAGISFVLIYGVVAQTGTTVDGYRTALLAGAAALVAAFITSLWIPRPVDAEASAISR